MENMEGNVENRKCSECGKEGNYYCKPCNSVHFYDNFAHWTSGDSNLNKLIQNSQLNADNSWELIEWIEYSNLEIINEVAQGGFGIVYKAVWKDGPIDDHKQAWNVNNSELQRKNRKEVAVKKFQNATLEELLNEVEINLKMNIITFAIETIRIYGVTRDPQTKEYAIVMEFQNDGDLRKMIKKNHSSLTWEVIIRMLWKISYGLHCIHDENYYHKDIHSGNILYDHVTPVISDFGLCRPLDRNSTDEIPKDVYGVLPFIAPEVIRCKEFTAAADIYGFGMLMSEIISGKAPFIDRDYDLHLALEICEGKRPKIPEYTPRPYSTLMKRCWDAVPTNRPTAWELREQFLDWLNIISSLDNPEVELSKDGQLATRQEIEEGFNKERENKWKEQLAGVVVSPQPIKASQNFLVSKRLDFLPQLLTNDNGMKFFYLTNFLGNKHLTNSTNSIVPYSAI